MLEECCRGGDVGGHHFDRATITAPVVGGKQKEGKVNDDLARTTVSPARFTDSGAT